MNFNKMKFKKQNVRFLLRLIFGVFGTSRTVISYDFANVLTYTKSVDVIGATLTTI